MGGPLRLRCPAVLPEVLLSLQRNLLLGAFGLVGTRQKHAVAVTFAFFVLCCLQDRKSGNPSCQGAKPQSDDSLVSWQCPLEPELCVRFQHCHD